MIQEGIGVAVPEQGGELRAVLVPVYENDGLERLIVESPPGIRIVKAVGGQELKEHLPAADILISNNLVYERDIAEIVRREGRRLKWIAFSTSGIDKAVKHGLPPNVLITNATGVKAPTVAEHGIFLLLNLFRQMRQIEMARKARRWARHELNTQIRSLEDAHLVVVGYGAIGQQIARKAKAFDMKVSVVSRAAQCGEHVDAVYPRGRIEEVFSCADAVIVASKLDETTFHMLGKDQIAALPRHAVVVNVSRGGLIDEMALIAALKDGKIAAAALDVMEVEPLSVDSPLWSMENVLVSPHVAGCGNDGYARFSQLFAENLRRFRANQPLLNLLRAPSAEG